MEEQKSYFPVTLSEAPCLKCGEHGCSSCNKTNAPDSVGDDAIKYTPNLYSKSFLEFKKCLQLITKMY